MKPSLIILLGVLAIALLLVVVINIPPPTPDRELTRLIPPGASEQYRTSAADMAVVTFTATQSANGLLEFYAQRLKFPHRIATSSGLVVMSHGRPFGRVTGDGFLPFRTTSGEGATLLRYGDEQLVMIALSSANEPLTQAAVVFWKLSERPSIWVGGNPALTWAPPEGVAGSSGVGYRLSIAGFTSPVPVADVALHYATNLGLALPGARLLTNSYRSGDGRVFLRQTRDHGQSFLIAREGITNLDVFVHCFRSLSDTQTQVTVGCVHR